MIIINKGHPSNECNIGIVLRKVVCFLKISTSVFLNDCFFHRCAQDMRFLTCLQQHSRQVRQKKGKRKDNHSTIFAPRCKYKWIHTK